MAAGIALSKAKIDGPGLAEAAATVLVRSNRMTVTTKAGGTVFEDATVQRVERLDRRTWQVTSERGVFTVVRSRDCGCGR